MRKRMSGENELQRWEINGNDSAQPVANEFSSESWGLTKREYFAGLAMQAWIQHHGSRGDYGYSDAEMAKTSKSSADALLKELDK